MYIKELTGKDPSILEINDLLILQQCDLFIVERQYSELFKSFIKSGNTRLQPILIPILQDKHYSSVKLRRFKFE